MTKKLHLGAVKPVFIFAVFVVLVLVTVAVYQVNKQLNKATLTQEPTIKIITQAEVDAVIKKGQLASKQQIAYAKKKASDPAFAKRQLEQLLVKSPKARKAYQLIKAATLPIKFYGKVLDKNNTPITQVQIAYSIGQAYGVGQPVHGRVVSGDNGNYVIEGTGALVRLLSFTKLNYVFIDAQQNFFSAKESGRPKSWVDHTVQNAYVTVGNRK